MNLKKFLKTWEGTEHENKWARAFIAGLLVTILVLSSLLFTKKTIVTMQPFTLHNEAWVTSNDASINYQEAWALALALLIGNVTPDTVGFIKDRIAPLLSPAIHGEVINVLEMQATEIKNDRVSLRFEPRFVEYEAVTKKVFVYGHSYAKGLSRDKETRVERTFEFDMKISNYLPVIDYLETYSGRPRTEEVLRKLERQETRNQERAAK